MAEDSHSPEGGQPSQAEAHERWIAVARITRPHGVRGEVRLAMFNSDSTLLLERPPSRLSDSDGAVQAGFRIEALRPGPHYLIARIRGVRHRDEAEALRGWQVEVPRSALAEAAEDEYYFCDLEGCDVHLQGERIGRVRRVADYPTCDALVIQRPAAKDIEVPLHADFVERIDVAQKCIELRTLEGLL